VARRAAEGLAFATLLALLPYAAAAALRVNLR